MSEVPGFDWCSVRSSWKNRREAQAAAQRMARTRSAALKAFCCTDCGLWHIGREGHAPGSVKRRRPSWDPK